MSLDILLCKVVPPEQASDIYTADPELDSCFVTNNVALDAIQAKGFICVEKNVALDAIQAKGFICVEKWVRLGRNCLNDDWHRRYRESVTDESHDDPDLYDRWERMHDEMMIVLPGEIEDKIGRWIIEGVDTENDEDGRFWRPPSAEDDWDFLYISW